MTWFVTCSIGGIKGRSQVVFAAYKKNPDALNAKKSDKLKGDSDFIKAISEAVRSTIAQHPWTDTLTNEYTHAAMNRARYEDWQSNVATGNKNFKTYRDQFVTWRRNGGLNWAKKIAIGHPELAPGNRGPGGVDKEAFDAWRIVLRNPEAYREVVQEISPMGLESSPRDFIRYGRTVRPPSSQLE